MKIIPAIDLINGQCVRLYQGDYKKQTIYTHNAVKLAKNYQNQGAKWLHLVDLDGAKQGKLVQLSLIKAMIDELTIPVQLGGGIRTAKDIEACLDIGVNKIVIGSLAVTNSQECIKLITEFGPEWFIIALDVNTNNEQPHVLSQAWSTNTGQLLWDLTFLYQQHGVNTILCTDVACDGTLTGPNISLYQQAKTRFPNIKWQASGGVRNNNDLSILSECGVDGAIVGKALYQAGVDLSSFVGK